MSASAAASPTIADSLREYGRGLAGGLIFSLPLLYTMEMWWTGFLARPERMLTYVFFTLALLLGYNRYAGLRRDASWLEVFIDSIEELGLGVVTSAAALYALGRIGPHTTLDEAIGMIVIEAGVVAIGFSVGTAQLGASDEGQHGMGSHREEPHLAGQLVIAFCGAVLFAANVAPTEEVLMIGTETAPERLLTLCFASLALGGLVLYFTNFTRAHHYSRTETHGQALRGSIINYAIALIASAIILWFFGRFEGHAPDVCVQQVIVLGLPATLGAAAGRLLLQS